MFQQLGVLFITFLLLWYLAFYGPAVNIRRRSSSRSDHARRRRRRQAALGDTTKPAVSERHSNDEPVDCSVDLRYCVDDSDCRILCRNYKRLLFHCDGARSTCEPVYINEQRPPADDPDAGNDCDARRGEYAMLAGYTTLGTAIWQCVQLYQQFRDRKTFCQNGGIFDMDATAREPSYRDCRCPSGTIRSVYNSTSAANFQLPHCIKVEHWPLYRLSMRAAAEDL